MLGVSMRLGLRFCMLSRRRWCLGLGLMCWRGRIAVEGMMSVVEENDELVRIGGIWMERSM